MPDAREERPPEPTATGPAAGAAEPAAGAAEPAARAAEPGAGATRRSAWRRQRWIILGVAAALLIGLNVYVAYTLRSQDNATVGANLRPSGIPGNIPTSLANMMQLSPLPGTRAPGFTLTDQRGSAMSLASLRGKVVVLEFMDPHCTDICPIVSQEFVDAYHQLGSRARKVVFAAINVNAYHATVADMAAFSTAHRLSTIPSWHFFTGPVPALRTSWRDYYITVQAPSRGGDIIHTSAVYFIDAQGRERFLASPMMDHTANGTSYLPLAQLSGWARGIARLASDLAR